MKVKRVLSDANQSDRLPTPAQNSERSPLLGLHPDIAAKCSSLYASGHYAEAVEKSFKVVRDRLRGLTSYETGSEAFGKGKLRVTGASAPHVENDLNDAVKFLTMAIDFFRNEKAHTSDAQITNPTRAEHYLMLSSLAMHLLAGAKVPATQKAQ
jgi:uncharacterized protein (TIGR02391 family)